MYVCTKARAQNHWNTKAAKSNKANSVNLNYNEGKAAHILCGYIAYFFADERIKHALNRLLKSH